MNSLRRSLAVTLLCTMVVNQVIPTFAAETPPSREVDCSIDVATASDASRAIVPVPKDDDDYSIDVATASDASRVIAEVETPSNAIKQRNDDIAKSAVAYAWETKDMAFNNDGTELYRELHDLFMHDIYFRSCDRAISTAVHWSGADDNFPAGNCAIIIDYMNYNKKLWENVGYLDDVKDNLMPGDIIIREGHGALYAGNDIIREKYSNQTTAEIVSANLGGHTYEDYYIDAYSPYCGDIDEYFNDGYMVYRYIGDFDGAGKTMYSGDADGYGYNKVMPIIESNGKTATVIFTLDEVPGVTLREPAYIFYVLENEDEDYYESNFFTLLPGGKFVMNNVPFGTEVRVYTYGSPNGYDLVSKDTGNWPYYRYFIVDSDIETDEYKLVASQPADNELVAIADDGTELFVWLPSAVSNKDVSVSMESEDVSSNSEIVNRFYDFEKDTEFLDVRLYKFQFNTSLSSLNEDAEDYWGSINLDVRLGEDVFKSLKYKDVIQAPVLVIGAYYNNNFYRVSDYDKYYDFSAGRDTEYPLNVPIYLAVGIIKSKGDMHVGLVAGDSGSVIRGSILTKYVVGEDTGDREFKFKLKSSDFSNEEFYFERGQFDENTHTISSEVDDHITFVNGESVLSLKNGEGIYWWERGDINIEEIDGEEYDMTLLVEDFPTQKSHYVYTAVNERLTSDMEVTKVATGSNADRNKDWNFTVTLGDTSVNGEYGDMTFADGVANFTLKHGEVKRATGLPDGITYKVSEKEANTGGYKTTAENAEGVTKAGFKHEVVFTNNRLRTPSYNSRGYDEDDDTGSLSLTKTVIGDGADLNRDWHFTVTLGRSLTGQYGDMHFQNGVANVTLKHGQSLYAYNLPSGIEYSIVETEANQDGYTMTASGATGHIRQGDIVYAEFTNTLGASPGKGNVTVSKIVTGDGDTSRAWNFQMSLSEPLTGQYGDLFFENGIASFQLVSGQVVTVQGLPAGVSYHIEELEANADGYRTTSSGADGAIPDGATLSVVFTNSLGIETVSNSGGPAEYAVPPTGDNSKLLFWIIALLGSGCLAAFCLWRYKRRDD